MTKTVAFGDLLKEVNQGIIVHGCNAQGVMGGGFAKDLREKYPVAYQKYVETYAEKGLELGSTVNVQINDKLWIVNGITQQNYGRDPSVKYVSYSAIQKVFRSVVELQKKTGLAIHFPLIGAGLANGNWAIISDIIEDELSMIVYNDYFLWLLED